MKIYIDPNTTHMPKDTSWQLCVGSGHAFLAHRTDWCEYTKRIHEELGVKYVRFHGIFDDDMLTDQRLSDFLPLPNAGKVHERSFRQVGKVYDHVLASGMKPFVELSCMPSSLASGKRTGLHYRNNITPPRSYAAWEKYIAEFVQYLIARYGHEEVESWYFEVWNEPDLKTFFTGSQQDYFQLYAHTVRALKSVDEKLRVGGPSTSAGKWLKEFLTFIENEKLPCDFVSTHQYPGDGFGNAFHLSDVFTKYPKIIRESVKNGLDIAQTISNIFFEAKDTAIPPKGILTEGVERSRRLVGKENPLFYTEWNSMAIFGSPAHDEKYTAAFALKTILDLNGQADCFSIWCCSDLFEEIMFINKPFHGGFGLINNLGIPKPSFWALKLLADALPYRLQLPMRTNQDVEYAAFSDGNKLQIFVYAQEKDYCANKQYAVELTVSRPYKTATTIRIDDDHCNPKRLWQEMGAPMDPTPGQVEIINRSSMPVKTHIPFAVEQGNTIVNIHLSSNDIVMIELE